MRLRNKKTGEIAELGYIPDGYFILQDVNTKEFIVKHGSLAELSAEWEDVPEEPKEWWYIDIHGPHKVVNNDEYFQQVKAASKEIGNYFSSREEAELAVRKLKAWKRLKDNGFKFEGTNNHKRKTGYFINYYLGKSFNSQDECEQAMKDLEFLFRGEE